MTDQSADDDELIASLKTKMREFVVTKRRHGLIDATLKEVNRLEEHRKGAKPGLYTFEVGNDAVNQLLRDAFDMLVIDLASIREGMLERGGLLGLLKDAAPERLKRVEPEDFEPGNVTILGEDQGIKEVIERANCQRFADAVNGTLDRLFPSEEPTAPGAVDALIKRFMKATSRLDGDRNHVRAHRYERRSFDRNKYFCSPDVVGQQIAVIQEYLVDLHFVLVPASQYLPELDFLADSQRVAENLADLLVHGSIDRAVSMYCKPNEEVHPLWWYSHCRRRFYGE